jgi:hypothetical protein
MLGGRLALFLFAAAVCIPGAARAQSLFDLRTIVQENIRTGFGTFRDVAVQGVTRQGLILFLADRPDFLDGEDQGLFLWTGERIVRLIGRDDRVPDGKVIEITAAVVAPRSAADRAFRALIRADDGGDEEAIFVSAQDRLGRVARIGEDVGPGSLVDIEEGGFQVNAQGEVLLLARIDTDGNGSADGRALLLYTGGRLRLLSREGGARAGGTVQEIRLFARSLNDRGRVAWEETVTADGATTSVVVISDRDHTRRILGSRDPLLGRQFLSPRNPVLNEAGNVALLATLDRDGDGEFDRGRDEIDVLLFRVEGLPATTVLLRSNRLERGNSVINRIDAFNDFNEAFVVGTGDTDNDGVLEEDEDREIAYVASISGVRALARGGRRLRLGDDVRGGELVLGEVIGSNSGLAAITAIVDGDGDAEFDPPGDEAVLLASDGEETVAVARDRQTFPTIFRDGQILQLRSLDGITDAGILVFTADLDRNRDGRIDVGNEGAAIFLAVPVP